MYVASIVGENVFHGRANLRILDDITIETLEHLDELCYERYDVHFDIHETKHVYRHNDFWYKEFDNISNDLDIKLVVEFVDVLQY